jgi:hypothetical protein
MILGIVVSILTLPIARNGLGVLDVSAQMLEGGVLFERGHSVNTENQAEGTLDKAKKFFNSILGWVGDRVKSFTDLVDKFVGVSEDNKGTNAMFGLPLYIFLIIVGIFAFKFIFNILRDMFKAMFLSSDTKPKGRRRR